MVDSSEGSPHGGLQTLHAMHSAMLQHSSGTSATLDNASGSAKRSRGESSHDTAASRKAAKTAKHHITLTRGGGFVPLTALQAMVALVCLCVVMVLHTNMLPAGGSHQYDSHRSGSYQ